MGVTPLRLLITSAALVIGAALMPALGANAAPDHVAAVTIHADREVAALTQSESALDSAAQRVSDPDSRTVADDMPRPPLWLLVLLVPILIGGAVGVGLTLRRVR